MTSGRFRLQRETPSQLIRRPNAHAPPRCAIATSSACAAALAVTQSCVEYWAARRESLDLTALVIEGLDHLKTGFAEAP